MLNPIYTSSFKKDCKLMQKQNKAMNKLDEVMDLLINEQPLLPKHNDHPLHGNHKGKRECHIEPDWLLMYRIDKASRQIAFYRTGSHSELF